MRRLSGVAVVLAVCLVGCSASNEFEKDILGHPAPEPASATNRPQTPPPPAAEAAPAPQPTPIPATGAAAQSPEPIARPLQPAPAAPTPTPPAAMPAELAPQPVPVPVKPRPASPQSVEYTFQVGAFAHVEHAKELVRALESKGFRMRMEQGKLKKRTFYTVFATKAGSRAAVEGELFAAGVIEPVLITVRHPEATPEPKIPTSAPVSRPAPMQGPGARTVPATPAPTTGTIRQAQPLPEGYVPPASAPSGS